MEQVWLIPTAACVLGLSCRRFAARMPHRLHVFQQLPECARSLRFATGGLLPETYLPLPTARARIAIRVGIPLLTSCTIFDWSESATSLVNSRPRMMGPGCMTIASRLAIFKRGGVIWEGLMESCRLIFGPATLSFCT